MITRIGDMMVRKFTTGGTQTSVKMQ